MRTEIETNGKLRYAAVRVTVKPIAGMPPNVGELELTVAVDHPNPTLRNPVDLAELLKIFDGKTALKVEPLPRGVRLNGGGALWLHLTAEHKDDGGKLFKAFPARTQKYDLSLLENGVRIRPILSDKDAELEKTAAVQTDDELLDRAIMAGLKVPKNTDRAGLLSLLEKAGK